MHQNSFVDRVRLTNDYAGILLSPVWKGSKLDHCSLADSYIGYRTYLTSVLLYVSNC